VYDKVAAFGMNWIDKKGAFTNSFLAKAAFGGIDQLIVNALQVHYRNMYVLPQRKQLGKFLFMMPLSLYWPTITYVV